MKAKTREQIEHARKESRWFSFDDVKKVFESLETDLRRTKREVESWKEECEFLEGELEDLTEKDRLMRIAISEHMQVIDQLTTQIKTLKKQLK